MQRIILVTLTAIAALFTLMFSLLLAIPLTIVALITGKKLEKQLRRQSPQHQQDPHVIEGEWEEVPRRH
ncbi:hypothetical protein [Vibrio navarrensis]|uniref:hypothetical protein n=1 Tax=Vibrio navarrensis TaxID=29495 RepID=UPI001559E625|nr:hypothetical protein [Vibrio navarrensis]